MVMLGTNAELCEHLDPLRRALREAGVAVGFGRPCPFGQEFGTWFTVDCTFDPTTLRDRLGLDDCVVYEEYEGRVTADADAFFYCTCCRKAIAGEHPRVARWTARRVG